MARIDKRLDEVQAELDRRNGGGVLFLLQDEDTPGVYRLENGEQYTQAELDGLKAAGLVLFEYAND